MPQDNTPQIEDIWHPPLAPHAPLVSIVIRTKDRPDTLQDALASVAQQIYSKIEAVIVNDAGIDVSVVIAPFREQIHAVKYVALTENVGRSQAANIGLEKTTGEFIGFLDDDDLFNAEHIANLVQVLTSHSDYQVAYSGVITQGTEIASIYNHPFDLPLLRTHNYIPIHAVLFSRSLLSKGCCFDAQLKVYEDWDFWLQLARHSRFYHIDQITAIYRYLGSSGVSPIHSDEQLVQQSKAILFEKWKFLWSGEEIDKSFLRLSADYKETLQKNEQHIHNLEAILQNLQTRYTDMDDRLNILTEEKESLEQKIIQYQQQLIQHKQHSKEQETYFIKALEEKETHIDNLDAMIKEKETTAQLLEKKIQQLEKKIQQLEKLYPIIEQQETRYKNTQNHVQNLQQIMDEKTQHLQEQADIIAKLNEELKQRDQSLVKVQHELHLSREHSKNIDLLYRNSLSWRITWPLRYIKQRLRAVKKLYYYREYTMQWEILSGIEQKDANTWVSIDADPQFKLYSTVGIVPSAWVRIHAKIDTDVPVRARLYYADQQGFNADKYFELKQDINGDINTLLRLPDNTIELRFDPLDEEGVFHLSQIIFYELGKIQLLQYLLFPQIKKALSNPKNIPGQIKKSYLIFKQNGFSGLKQELLKGQDEYDYAHWIMRNDTLKDNDIEAITKHIKRLEKTPCIAVIMPVYNTEIKWLQIAIESVQQQLYPYWELCIVDDASSKPQIKTFLQQWAAKDERIKVTFRDKNGHISVASNNALQSASGEFIALLDHDDKLAIHALYHIAVSINQHPEVGLIYSDEDKINAIEDRYDPYFKPDWNPLLLLGQNYINHLSVYRKSWIDKVGGFRIGYEGSQDHDLALRVTEQLSAKQIIHIPKILYHWRALAGSTALNIEEKNYTSSAAYKALKDHFQRIGKQQVNIKALPYGRWRIQYPVPKKAPKVSLIMPTRNGYEVLYRCVESLYKKTCYPDFELIIVDNQSDDPKVLDYLKQLQEKQRAKVIHYDAKFNYSAINNYALSFSEGEIIGLLNNDLEIISEDWLYEMVSYAIQKEVGVVGAKLYYPDGRIQHAGVILGAGGIAGHAYARKPKEYPGQMDRAFLAQNMVAVTAACLLVRKSVYLEVGGLNEKELAVAFNDIDFCIRVHQQGYWNVWTPFAQLYHHESATRGYEDTPEKQARFQKECQYMETRWKKQLQHDPTFNPNLSIGHSVDFDWTMDIRVVNDWK